MTMSDHIEDMITRIRKGGASEDQQCGGGILSRYRDRKESAGKRYHDGCF